LPTVGTVVGSRRKRREAHMRKLGLLLACGTAAFCVANSWAIPLGDNVTISDQVFLAPGVDTDWYTDREDEETEPWTAYTQEWDVEAFFYDSNLATLTAIGGYDFRNGVESGTEDPPRYLSGDLFIDITGDAVFGPGALGTGADGTIANVFGYDYVFDLNFDTIGNNHTYTLYAIDSTAILDLVQEIIDDHANPWLFDPAKNPTIAPVPGYVNLALQYETGLSDADVGGLLGGTHNGFSVGLGFLPYETQVVAHYTYGCGNDNLMGQFPTKPPKVADAGATALLMGVALVGLRAMRKHVR
jgi:hypothetical protein